jgi:pimeloyl-ACP methyl ester carboxylesterase
MLAVVVSSFLAGQALTGTWSGSIGSVPAQLTFRHDETGYGVLIRNTNQPWRNPVRIACELQDGATSFELNGSRVSLKLSGSELASTDKSVVLQKEDSYELKQVPLEIRISTGRFAGQLMLPTDVKTPPVAIYVPGRGGGRMSNIGLGIELVRRGFAFATMDEPGTGLSEGNRAADTHKLKVERYSALFDDLAKSGLVDSSRIGLISSSAGGWTSAEIGSNKPIHFWIGLVAPSESVLEQQRTSFARLLREVTPALSKQEHSEAYSFVEAMLDVVMGKRDKAEVDKLRESLEGRRFETAAEVELQTYEDNISWLTRFNYDPSSDLRRIQGDCLLILGEADPVVDAQVNEKLYAERLGSRGKVVIAPRADHSLSEPIVNGSKLSSVAQNALHSFLESL